MELSQTMKELLLNANLNKGTINSVSLSSAQALERRGLITDHWAKALSPTTTQGGSFPIYHDIKLTEDGLTLAKKLQMEHGKIIPRLYISIPIEKENYIRLVEYLSENSSHLDPSSAIGQAINYWIERSEDSKDTTPKPEGAYLGFDTLYLPQGTAVRTLHKNQYHHGVVVDQWIRHECPDKDRCFLALYSRFQSFPWDLLEIKKPTDEEWIPIRNFMAEVIAKAPLYQTLDNSHPPCPQCGSKHIYELYYGTVNGLNPFEEKSGEDKYTMFGGSCCPAETYQCMTCLYKWY